MTSAAGRIRAAIGRLGRDSVSDLRSAREQALEEAAPAVATQTTTAAHARAFGRWCEVHGFCALPASEVTLATYIADRREDWHHSTCQTAVGAIRRWHAEQGHEPPSGAGIVKDVLNGIAADKGRRTTPVIPLLYQAYCAMLESIPTWTTSMGSPRHELLRTRTKAMLGIAFFGGPRGGELVRMEHEEIDGRAEMIAGDESRPAGAEHVLRIDVPFAKHHPEGRTLLVVGRSFDPDHDPVALLDTWSEASGVSTGPVFRRLDRSGHVGESHICLRQWLWILKGLAAHAQLQGRYGTHSPRRGLACEVAALGAGIEVVQYLLGHEHAGTSMGYLEEADLFDGPAHLYL